MSNDTAYIVIHNLDGTESEPITPGIGGIADFSYLQNIKVSSRYKTKKKIHMTYFNLQGPLHMHTYIHILSQRVNNIDILMYIIQVIPS